MFIVKVPGINGKGTEGCERAGEAIINELREIHANEQGKIVDVDMLDLEEIHLDNGNLELTNKLIYENSLKIFETKIKTIFLGGDHSISYSLVRGFFEHCKNSEREPCLIVFDSRPNCMPVTKGTEKHNQIFPAHEEWLRALVESGFPSENVLLVGVRNSDLEEINFLREKRIRVISMNQFMEDLEDSCDIIMEFSNGKELYLSIDISVIDPAFAPATVYREPGGLTSREFIYLIHRINLIKNLRGIDIVEINAAEDKKFGGITVKLGAKILSELL
ncbi:MAG: arginase family protein [Nanoarchaeota archaeon]